MNPLLEQFLSESRDLLESIGSHLMQLEDAPGDQTILNELFRCVHTLKGNSGLFTFPEMTRVLHAGEDLLGLVRGGQVSYSRQLADPLLEAMDFVGLLCQEIEATGQIDSSRTAESQQIATALRRRIPDTSADRSADTRPAADPQSVDAGRGPRPSVADLPEPVRAALRELDRTQHRTQDRSQDRTQNRGGGPLLHWVAYRPQRECFFNGDDPLHCARQTPGLVWGRVVCPAPLPPLAELDTYSCLLGFDLLTNAPCEELDQYYRYLPEQVRITPIDPEWFAQERPELSGAGSLSEEEQSALHRILAAQRQILLLDDRPAWHPGRIKAVGEVLTNVCRATGDDARAGDLEAGLAEALATGRPTRLLAFIEEMGGGKHRQVDTGFSGLARTDETTATDAKPLRLPVPEEHAGKVAPEDGIKFGRRAEDALPGARSLKVDQAKIDRLMNLIGELVVSKNALPYLAERAESQFGVRELAREIKGQYSIINRIADEMQDAIMQVRMLAVSFVFQRFPRLVRDLSHKLGKEVQLVLEGEQTEADKNIIESLADPLIHIVRNSLDHGLETPEVRLAAGKPAAGRLVIRAVQQADRVLIEVIDDGRGIDPAVIKRKACEKGIIDEAMLQRIGDQEALNLIFAAGLSTAAVVSDLSGRGVGMDVVRSAVEKINGTVVVTSELGKGTTIRISLPLSMAVTQVMVIESDHQLFGVPMDHVVETVRIPRSSIRTIKHSQAAVLRGHIVPLKSLNALLGITALPQSNSDDELAVLLVQAGGIQLGLLVDGFEETIGVIQKPLAGFLGGLSVYSGSALMGNGSVLMILNIREIL